MDRITIENLEVFSRIGITAGERATPQRLLVSMVIFTTMADAAASDDLADTIDYARVSEEIKARAAQGERNLLERLAWELAEMVVEEFNGQASTVEIKKFVVPGADYVSVKMAHRGKK